MEFTTDQPKTPQFLKSITDLAALSAAIDTFKRQYDDLQNHIDYISIAIDSNLKSNGINITAAINVNQSVQDKTEGQLLCEMMCKEGLRGYIYWNISDRAKLMEELPSALKFAKEPAKFVLECIGNLYLESRTSDREISVIILECFLLMPQEVEIESSVKAEAEGVSIAWRNRLISEEGGIVVAGKLDARGLLLLIACFGVPSSFRNMDLLDLIRQSGAAKIVGALRRSPFLFPMLSGIVESSINCGKHIEALEVVYTFGIEDKVSASSVLVSYLKMSKDSFERAKRNAHSPMTLKEANEKQLTALVSVMQFLETHKLDPAKEVPGWQIKEQIINLEKERSISLMYNQEIKRPRLSEMEMPLPPPPVPSSSYSHIYHDQSFLREEDKEDEISALVSSYLGPPSSFPHRVNPIRSPEYMVPHGGFERSVSAYEHIPLNSYSSVHGQRLHREYSPPVHRQQQHIPYDIQRLERYLGLPNHRSSH